MIHAAKRPLKSATCTIFESQLAFTRNIYNGRRQHKNSLYECDFDLMNMHLHFVNMLQIKTEWKAALKICEIVMILACLHSKSHNQSQGHRQREGKNKGSVSWEKWLLNIAYVSDILWGNYSVGSLMVVSTYKNKEQKIERERKGWNEMRNRYTQPMHNDGFRIFIHENMSRLWFTKTSEEKKTSNQPTNQQINKPSRDSAIVWLDMQLCASKGVFFCLTFFDR